MAIAASILSQRFMRASRFSQAVDALFKKDDTKTAARQSDLEKDLLELSPMNQMRQTITRFRSQTTVSELNLKLTVSSDKPLETGGADPKLERDLDLMLRMISKDEKEYESLKARFEKLLKQAQGSTSTGEEAAPVAAEASVEASAESSAVVSSSTSGNIATGRQSQALTTEEMSASLARRNSYELNLKFRQNTTVEERIGISLEELGIKKVDPLVLDLDGKGIQLTEAGKGAIFDVTADGKLDSTAWVKGNTALLTYDRNGNGVVDNGSELFGDQNGAADGFEELGKYDANGDRKITILDPIFKALKLYRDLNGDGKMSKNEFSTLSELGIKALNLNFMRASADINGNSLILNGSFEREDGSTGQLADVLLGYRTIK
ncbi:MAG TPA: hypothetical protein PLK58_05360 [Candidatus Rifleibacterium sp.]|nr:hypothetical protein [Candidatus Rifleibacterium sp.]